MEVIWKNRFRKKFLFGELGLLECPKILTLVILFIFSVIQKKKKVRIYCLDILNTVVTGSVFSICLTAKMARLKQAKDEAAKEIAEYRAQVEKDFQKKLEEVMFLYFSVTSWWYLSP